MHALRTAVASMLLLLSACAAGPVTSPGQGGSPTGADPTSAPSQAVAPTPTATPTATPEQRTPEVDSLVQTMVENLFFREEPILSAARIGTAPVGLRAWVVDGPVRADSYQWFRLIGESVSSTDASGCLRPIEQQADVICEWIGWAAGVTEDGDVWLAAADVDCPIGRDVQAYLALTSQERLHCAGSDEWQWTVYIPPLGGGRGCFPAWVTDPGWMDGACTFTLPQPEERKLDQDGRLQVFTPPSLNTCGHPESPACWWDDFKGQWVEVVGHLDDPVARTCQAVPGPLADQFGGHGPPPDPDLVVHRCRLNFVVSSVSAATPP